MIVQFGKVQGSGVTKRFMDESWRCCECKYHHCKGSVAIVIERDGQQNYICQSCAGENIEMHVEKSK